MGPEEHFFLREGTRRVAKNTFLSTKGLLRAARNTFFSAEDADFSAEDAENTFH